jgi:hypothetical protein
MRLIAVVVLASTTASAAPAPEVRVDVYPADNLADTANPIPELAIYNDSKSPIEVQIFGGVPLTTTQVVTHDSFEPAGTGMCGNGFTPHVIAPHDHAFFALWGLVDHGPGASGTYHVRLPYTVLRGKRRVEGEATSDPFELAYGDVAPLDPKDAKHPGHVVIVSAERGRNARDQPSPAALATELLPDASACVAAAQQRLPWLRGCSRSPSIRVRPLRRCCTSARACSATRRSTRVSARSTSRRYCRPSTS